MLAARLRRHLEAGGAVRSNTPVTHRASFTVDTELAGTCGRELLDSTSDSWKQEQCADLLFLIKRRSLPFSFRIFLHRLSLLFWVGGLNVFFIYTSAFRILWLGYSFLYFQWLLFLEASQI